MLGAQGLNALINDNRSIYVVDNSPVNDTRYRARFYFDPNSIMMTSGNKHYTFYAYNASGTVVFRLEFQFNGVYQVRASILNDSSTFSSTAWHTISDGPHPIEFDWLASSAPGANNGSVTLWIDGAQKEIRGGIDNDTRRVESIRLGAVSGVDSGTRGTEFFDAFESRRSTYIGP